MNEEKENLFFAQQTISGIRFNIYSSEIGIRKISFGNLRSSFQHFNITTLHPDDPYMFNVFNELIEYFDRKRKYFSIPLDTHGTEFQKRVWRQLLNIPYGKTISYMLLAKLIGNSKATRAVGKANGENPLPILIPCHRVINSDGKLGGYSGGLGIKEKLLELEGSLSLKLI